MVDDMIFRFGLVGSSVVMTKDWERNQDPTERMCSFQIIGSILSNF